MSHQPRTVLITGGTGFLGQTLQQVLREQAPDVDVRIFARPAGGDVRNFAEVREAVVGVDLVIHAAAHTSIGSSVAGQRDVDVEFFATNTQGTINVVNACREARAKLIMISTAEVYGTNQTPGEPMTEDHPLMGRSGAYTISKLAAEQYCLMGYETQGDNVVILRLFTMFGPYQSGEKVVPIFLRQARAGQVLSVHGDGQQQRDFVHVRDVARAVWLSRDLPAGTVCNVASGRSYSMLSLAQLVQAAARRKERNVSIEFRPARANDVPEFRGSHAKLTQLTGWQPELFLDEQIDVLADWYFAAEPPPTPQMFAGAELDDLIPQKAGGIEYASAVYGQAEIEAVRATLAGRWLAPAAQAEEFERRVAHLFGKEYGLFVNSGSSANLLALAALKLPPGSEVIVPACTFPTTFAPIYQLGLVPVVVDSDPATLNIRLDLVEEAITEQTRAMIVQHTYGNLNDLVELRAIADRHDLYLIEDSCDTIGGSLRGQPTGTWSHITTMSFYFVHHITAAGGGGMVMFHDKVLRDRAHSMRDWGRQSLGYGENLEERYAQEVAPGIRFDAKFLFTESAYNLKGIEAQAAFGLKQLERLPRFIALRADTVARLRQAFEQWSDVFMLPESLPEAEVSWLTLPVTIRDGAPFTRLDLVKFMEEERHIQTRPLWGNIVRHPAYREVQVRTVGDMSGADKLMRDTVLVPCHHGLAWKDVEHIIDSYRLFVERHSAAMKVSAAVESRATR